MSIRKKLMLISVGILAPVLAFLLLAYRYWSDFLYQEALDSFNVTNQQLIQTIEDNIRQRQIIVRTLCESSRVREMVVDRDPARAEVTYRRDVEPVMEVLTETAKNGQMLWVLRYDNAGYEDIHCDYEGIVSGVKTNTLEIEKGLKDYAVFNVSRISRQRWFQDLKGNLEEYRVQRTNFDYLNHCFSIVAEIKAADRAVGMIRLISPIRDFIGLEEPALSPDGRNVFVLDDEFYLVSSQQWKKEFMSDNLALFEPAVAQMRRGERYQGKNGDWIISADELGSTGFYLVVMAASEALSQKSQQLQFVLLFCVSMIFILVSVFVLGISRYLTGRLLRLLEAMRQFRGSAANAKVAAGSSDEFGMLYAGYNQMTERISALMERNVALAREKEKANLHLLQMQINPHFLYNSLSTIQRLAEFDKTDLIQRMVFALTRFYRLSLNKGRQTYTVRDEMQQLEAYIDIFAIRKGDVFSWSIRTDSADADVYIPKLLLQPFVENILQHAFDRAHPFVDIAIAERTEDGLLLFTVEDNGCGMDAETLAALREGRRRAGGRGGFGIHNVLSRLRLFYGAQFQFQVQSSPGAGTKISIRLPKLAQAEAERLE